MISNGKNGWVHKTSARYIKLTCLVACALFLCSSAIAGDQAITAYSATTAQSPVKRGCRAVIFFCIAGTGTIGNSGAFASYTGTIPIPAVGDNQTLGAIPYTITSGAN